MRDIVFTVLFAIALPYCLIHSELAIALWYWASLFQPQTQVWGFARSIPFSLIAGITAIAAWAFFKGPRIPKMTAIVVLLLLLVLWTGVTTFNAVYFDAAWDEWNLFVRLIAMVIISIVIVQTRRNLDILLWTICLSIGYYGLKVGLFSLRGGLGAEIHGPKYMNGNNEIARAMIMYLPFLAYLYSQSKRAWIRAGLGVVSLSSIALLVLSGSRGAWLGAIAVIGYIALRTRRGFLWIAACGLLSLAVVPLLPERIVDRFMSIQQFTMDKSVQGRLNAWRYAFDKFPERPIMGGGFKVFDLEHKKASHDSYVQMLGEHGAIGLLLYLALLTAAFAASVSIRRSVAGRSDLRWAADLSYCTQLSLVGYAVGGISINEAFFPVFYAVLGVLGSLQIIVAMEIKRTDSSEPHRLAQDSWRGWRAARAP